VSTAPLFSFREARIEAPGGGVLAPALTFQTDAERVVLVGAWDPLIALLTGRAGLGSGHAEVLGEKADRAVFDNRMALALREPAFPEKPTPHEYLTSSARLIGMGKRDAAKEADRALETLGLTPLRKKKLKDVAETDRRILALAHAILGAPTAILVERPFESLDDGSVERLAVALEKAGSGRRLVVVLGAPGGAGPEQRFVARAGHAVVSAEGVVVSQGRPEDVFGPSRRYVVWVTRQAASLESVLVSRGLGVVRLAGDGADDARLVVDLGKDGTSDAIRDAAVTADAPVIELSPMGLSVRGS